MKKVGSSLDRKAQCAHEDGAGLPPDTLRVILPIEKVVLQSPWQRQETHEDRRAQTEAPEAATDAQTAEMLQTTGVLCRRWADTEGQIY